MVGLGVEKLDFVCKMQRRGISWLEACYCHEPLFQQYDVDDIRTEILSVLRSCPLQCRRALEFCNGEILRVSHGVANTYAGDWNVKLSRVLCVGDRLELLQQFDMGRAHVLFYITAKVSYAHEEPWHVACLAHLDHDVAMDALRRVKDSHHPHPLLRLIREQLREEIDIVLEGEHRIDAAVVSNLASIIGALRFLPTSERPGEEQHAKTLKQGLRRHYHTEHDMSVALRAPELADRVKQDPVFVKEMGLYCKIVGNAKSCCSAVGLMSYPSMQQHRRASGKWRHPIFG